MSKSLICGPLWVIVMRELQQINGQELLWIFCENRFRKFLQTVWLNTRRNALSWSYIHLLISNSWDLHFQTYIIKISKKHSINANKHSLVGTKHIPTDKSFMLQKKIRLNLTNFTLLNWSSILWGIFQQRPNHIKKWDLEAKLFQLDLSIVN